MPSRPVNDTATSHYAVLGVSRGATDEDIKRAYHKKAKSAHPDAGGSAAAMSKVNSAYQTLIDPILRRDYDSAQAAASPSPTHSAAPARPTRPSQPPRPHHAADAEAAQIDRNRTVWARRSAWGLLTFTAPFAAAAALIHVFAADFITDQTILFMLGIITFFPVYLFGLSIVFLTDPPLRLIFADLVRLHHTTKHERRAALAVVLAYFPLAAIWAIWR